jgi:biopolymer transport protein ExbB
MAYERDHTTGAPQDYRVADTRSNGGLIAALVIVVALVIGAIALFSGDRTATVPATPEPATAPLATEPAPPAVPDAVPSTPAPDATAPDAGAPASGADSDVGDPAVPGIPAEDAAPAD